MKNITSRFYQTYLNPALDFLVRAFNAMLSALVIVGTLMTVVSILVITIIEMVAYMASFFISKFYPHTVSWFESETDI